MLTDVDMTGPIIEARHLPLKLCLIKNMPLTASMPLTGQGLDIEGGVIVIVRAYNILMLIKRVH